MYCCFLWCNGSSRDLNKQKLGGKTLVKSNENYSFCCTSHILDDVNNNYRKCSLSWTWETSFWVCLLLWAYRIWLQNYLIKVEKKNKAVRILQKSVLKYKISITPFQGERFHLYNQQKFQKFYKIRPSYEKCHYCENHV